MHRRRSAQSRADVLCAAIAVALVACLLLPALAASNGSADRNFCLRQMKELILALHNYHDSRNAFPFASTQPITHQPGASAPDTAAGYSWLAHVTPYLPQSGDFGSALFKASERMQKPPFDPSFTVSANDWVPAFAVQGLICPSFTGESRVSGESDYAAPAGGELPAIANYYAFAGSHLMNTEGAGRLLSAEQVEMGTAYEGNGAFPFPWGKPDQRPRRGLGFAAIADGTSNTLAFAESKEPTYAAWIDGQVMWLVAAWPGNPKLPGPQRVANRPNMVMGWSEEDKADNRLAVQFDSQDAPEEPYLAADRWSGTHPRRWGASSNHPGVVGHAFVDGRVEMLSGDIDPNVYLHLVTRNGREVIPPEAKAALQTAPRTLPGRTRPGIRQIDQAWSPVAWSPVKVGDLELTFPDLLALWEFRLRGGDRKIAEYTGQSRAFSSITYDRDKSEFILRVADRFADSAVPGMYKQLRIAFDDDGDKQSDQKPKRVVWRKDAKWEGGAATFEFSLVEGAEKEPSYLKIRVLESSEPSGDETRGR